ncbi:ATP-dependent nuclease [Lacticaseibacillus suibinensis]|uniref:ATP-dependent nuclease n=1 Tax=Lacticaseibacillus suibinensis TaxID=2486011 RepID=UPI000F7A0DD5|nr:AAA family ATPase [Lacticaseibacillus suibinensis]
MNYENMEEKDMKLTKLIIDGFRSYGESTTIDFDNITTLIGSNGAGKTTALIALNKMFSVNANDRIISPTDFFVATQDNGELQSSTKLTCEAVFEFEQEDDSASQKHADALLLKHLCVKGPGEALILRIQLVATLEDDGTADGAIDSHIYYVPTLGVCKDEDLVLASRRELQHIRLIYVPAVRNPDTQLGTTSKSLLANLVRHINWGNETKQLVDAQLDSLNDTILNSKGVKLIGDSLSADWNMFHENDRFADVRLNIESTSLGDLAKRMRPVFQSSISHRTFQPEEMGDGTRSLFYISNVASVLEVERKLLEAEEQFSKDETTGEEHARLIDHQPPVLTILAIEEPENHISPHLLGKLVNQLKAMADYPNAQVVLTSHSPAIVKRVTPECIRYVWMNKDTDVSSVQSLEIPNQEDELEAYRYVKMAVELYPELYFAQLVILGEGASEEILLPKFLELSGKPLDESGISFVPLAGRFVHYIWHLLTQLQIPYISLLDLDRERSGGGWGRVSYVLKELRQNSIDVNAYPDGITDLSEASLQQLSERKTEDSVSANQLDQYLKYLQKYNVFFSAPLDIDFVMLSSYKNNYLGLVQGKQGPTLKVDGKRWLISEYPKQDENDSSYALRVEKARKDALKKDNSKLGPSSGNSYSFQDRELMIWYVYFFLGRGKTTTHIQALTQMNDDALKAGMPSLFSEIAAKASQLLGKEPVSHD